MTRNIWKWTVWYWRPVWSRLSLFTNIFTLSSVSESGKSKVRSNCVNPGADVDIYCKHEHKGPCLTLCHICRHHKSGKLNKIGSIQLKTTGIDVNTIEMAFEWPQELVYYGCIGKRRMLTRKVLITTVTNDILALFLVFFWENKADESYQMSSLIFS